MSEITSPNSILCPICGNLCSTQAANCPKCGHPINQDNLKVEKPENSTQPASRPSNTGSILRGVLWVFFVISLFFALDAIGIYSSKPKAIKGIFGDWDNYDQVNAANFAIIYHLAPLIIMIIILAITYSAKERK